MPQSDGRVRLLSLDGGGVRALSSLIILQQLMQHVDPEAPPKPCDYFDMIGGTGTGGLLAVMLGRLQMTVQECIDAYTALCRKVFVKSGHYVNFRGQIKGRFDSSELEKAVKSIVQDRGLDENALLKDPDAPCKVFVCALRGETAAPVCLSSYMLPRGHSPNLFDTTTVWQACCATFAATAFFDPISIGALGETFVAGDLGHNNPVYMTWSQAQDVWDGGQQLRSRLQCLVSIGTGVLGRGPVAEDILGMWSMLQAIAKETEKTAEQFHRHNAELDDEGRYFRFNVAHDLEKIQWEEWKRLKDISAATLGYVESQSVFKQIKACASSISGQGTEVVPANHVAPQAYAGPYRVPFNLRGVPVSANFVPRPLHAAKLKEILLPSRHSQESPRRKVCVIHGLGGMGKTQLAVAFARDHRKAFSAVFWLDGRSEDQLKQSLVNCARRLPQDQIPERSRGVSFNDNVKEVETVVEDVLDWFARDDNTEWLLIFDNVDKNHLTNEKGSYDVGKYLPSDHGSVIVTTRLESLDQLGEPIHLIKADEELAKRIFEKWLGKGLAMDETGKDLLCRLDGLPLALAQAASYIREAKCSIVTYVDMYKNEWDRLMKEDSFQSLDYEKSIATTWTVSFNAIQTENEDAANMLRLWAFIDNKDMWHGLFMFKVRYGGNNYEYIPQWVRDIATQMSKFLDIIRLLKRYSMIEAQESTEDSYTMHPVVHRWMQHMQDHNDKTRYVAIAVLLIANASAERFVESQWSISGRLIVHAERCLWSIRECWDDKRHCNNMIAKAIATIPNIFVFHDRGKYQETMLRWATEKFNSVLGQGSTESKLLARRLVYNYAHQQRYADAAKVLGSLQNESEDTPGQASEDFWTQIEMGSVYMNTGNLKDAEALLQKAVQGCEEALEMDADKTLKAATGLGRVYELQGQLKKAEKLYQSTVQRFRETLKPDDVYILKARHTLSAIYMGQGRLEEAEALHRELLQSLERTLGRDHMKVFTEAACLGAYYTSQHRYKEATLLLQQALEGCEKHFSQSLVTGSILFRLGVIAGLQGQLDEAEEKLLRALDVHENALGPDHVETLDVVAYIAPLACRKEKFERAEKMQQRVANGYEKALGPDHTKTLFAIQTLGLISARRSGG